MAGTQTVENVQALSAGSSTRGTLKLADFHIIFSAPVPQEKTAAAAAVDHKQKHAGPAVRHRESWITYPIINYLRLPPDAADERSSFVDPSSLPGLQLCLLQLPGREAGARGL